LEKLNETYEFKSLIITSDSQLRQKSFQEDEIDDCNVSETINYNQKSENEEFQQHKEKYNHKGSKSKQKQKSFTCKQCNKTFKYRYYFEVHNSSHTGQKPYVCNICNKAFSMRWVLKCILAFTQVTNLTNVKYARKHLGSNTLQVVIYMVVLVIL
jgi:hypothetical protein